MTSPDRARLIGHAYRLTSSRADAEDLVQEALLRLERVRRRAAEGEGEGIRDVEAWLTTVTTRLALDHLRSARVRREAYVGPWLPEPVGEDVVGVGPEEEALMAESVTTAMLVVLETMSPLERAVFVLHDVFAYTHEEVAAMLERSPAAVRQTARRARQHVEARRPRFEVDPERRRVVGERFLAAAETMDLDALLGLISPDVVFRSDGGGVVVAARKVLHGAERVTAFLSALVARGGPGWTFEAA